MNKKPVVRREQADRDIDQATAYYFAEGGVALELRFLSALEAAIRTLARNTTIGSPRYAVELNLPGLRLLQVRRFPQLIFYVEGPNHVEVWRVLHGQRDIPAGLQQEDGG